MKPFSLIMLVCAALVACGPRPGQVPPTDPGAACVAGKQACVVDAGGVAVIRTPKYWLIDVGDRTQLDVAVVMEAAKPCDGSKGCGKAIAAPEAQALAGKLAQAKIEQLPVEGGQAAAYRIDERKSVIQIWGGGEDLARVLPQLATVPLVGCTGCGLCIPAQCVLPPPVPPRTDELIQLEPTGDVTPR